MTQTTKWVGSLIALAILGWLLFGFFGVQALFMDKTVNDPLPQIQDTSTQPTIISTSSAPVPAVPIVEVSPSSRLIAEGSFQQGDSTYTIKGKALVTEQDGVRTISLTDFDVTNGPDLFVYIVSAANTENTTVKNAVGEKRFVNIGALKGNRGNQTYILPAEVELNDQSTVTIWCRRFFRNFGAADLKLAP